MLTTKPTTYKGFKFRSRLEARWSVFFDALGVKWEYEKDAYDLDGLTYIPDFWLPQYRLWLEIKGELINDEVGDRVVEKCQRLARLSVHPVVLAFSDPLDSKCAVFGITGKLYTDAHMGTCPHCGAMAVIVQRGEAPRRILCQNAEQHHVVKNVQAGRRLIFKAATEARQIRFKE